MKCIFKMRKEPDVLVMKFVSMNWEKLLIGILKAVQTYMTNSVRVRQICFRVEHYEKDLIGL